MKRPLLFAAWGFVLGEVYLRLPMVWQILTLVLLCSGGMVLWMKWNKSGRNLVVWMMPLFFCAFWSGAFVAGAEAGGNVGEIYGNL